MLWRELLPSGQASPEASNAGGEPRPVAEATQERTLLGVGSTAIVRRGLGEPCCSGFPSPLLWALDTPRTSTPTPCVLRCPSRRLLRPAMLGAGSVFLSPSRSCRGPSCSSRCQIGWNEMIGREAIARVRGTSDPINHGPGNQDHASKLLSCYGSYIRAAKARNSRGISGPALPKTISVAPRASRSARRACSSLGVPVKVSRFASVIGTWARSCSFISMP